MAWPLKIGVGVGKDLGPPRPRQRGDPRAPSCWEVNTGPRRLPGPSRAGLVTFWASSRAYRPLWQGAQEAACSPPQIHPRVGCPFAPSAPAQGWGARVDTAVPRLGCRGPHTHQTRRVWWAGRPLQRERGDWARAGGRGAQRGPGVAQGVRPTPAHQKPGHSHSPWGNATPCHTTLLLPGATPALNHSG